jgi:hypothetical protein
MVERGEPIVGNGVGAESAARHDGGTESTAMTDAITAHPCWWQLLRIACVVVPIPGDGAAGWRRGRAPGPMRKGGR